MRLIIRLMHHVVVVFLDDLLAAADLLCLLPDISKLGCRLFFIPCLRCMDLHIEVCELPDQFLHLLKFVDQCCFSIHAFSNVSGSKLGSSSRRLFSSLSFNTSLRLPFSPEAFDHDTNVVLCHDYFSFRLSLARSKLHHFFPCIPHGSEVF